MTAASPLACLRRIASTKPRAGGWPAARLRTLSSERMRLRCSTSSCLRARMRWRMSVMRLLSREFARGGDELVKLRPRRARGDRPARAVDAVGDVLGHARYVQRSARVERDDLARQPVDVLERLQDHRLRLGRA